MNLFWNAIIKLVTRISLSLFIFTFFSCDGRKEIPFELTDNRIILKANVNGTSGRFMWDTGAQISEVNCNLDNLDFSRRGRVSWLFLDMETESKDFYYLPEITIEGVQLKTKSEITKSGAVKYLFLDEEGLDGILGINVFAGYWCEVSFSKRRIILHKKKPSRFGTYVPANLEDSYFRILVDIDEKESPFYVDTGAPEIYFPPSVILGKTKDEYKKMLSPKRKKSEFSMQSYYMVKTNKISVFDDSFENKTIITNSAMSFGGEPSIKNARGLLGIEFLKDYDLLFDFTTQPYSTSGLYYKRINTERDEKRLFPLEEARVGRILESGIYSFYRTPEGITLGVIAGSVLNTEYGITERTIITKVDGKPVQEISDTDMWNMDIFKVKNFTVLEDGDEWTMEFKLGNR
jgi:hypothetical protein